MNERLFGKTRLLLLTAGKYSDFLGVLPWHRKAIEIRICRLSSCSNIIHLAYLLKKKTSSKVALRYWKRDPDGCWRFVRVSVCRGSRKAANYALQHLPGRALFNVVRMNSPCSLGLMHCPLIAHLSDIRTERGDISVIDAAVVITAPGDLWSYTDLKGGTRYTSAVNPTVIVSPTVNQHCHSVTNCQSTLS